MVSLNAIFSAEDLGGRPLCYGVCVIGLFDESAIGSYLLFPFFHRLHKQDYVGYMAVIRRVKGIEVE
jgi:hypothetical protein